MTSIEIARPPVEQLKTLIQTHSLPEDTRERVAHAVRLLAEFPEIGQALESPRPGLRVLLGPWRWMLIVYVYVAADDKAIIVGFEDGRSANLALLRR